MKNILSFAIAIGITVFFINFINISNQVKQSAIKSETIVANAVDSFLDTVADSGAINYKDYIVLMNQLGSTGGTFDVAINVTRLYPVPDPTQAGSFYMDYRPAYGWHSSKGGIQADYRDAKWPEGINASPVGVQYFVKSDNIAVTIKQTDAMDYQRSVITRLAMTVQLGEWNRSKAVRNTGNSIVGNE